MNRKTGIEESTDVLVASNLVIPPCHIASWIIQQAFMSKWHKYLRLQELITLRGVSSTKIYEKNIKQQKPRLKKLQ